MKRLLLFLLLASPAFAQVQISVSPAYSGTSTGTTCTTGNVCVPIKTFQTFTATVTGLNDKRVTWSTSGGTLSTTSCAEAMTEPCTVDLYTTTPGTYVVTATASDGTHTAQGGVTFTATPTPLTAHPREMFTSADLTALQAWFAAGGASATELAAMGASSAATDDAAMSTGSGGGGYNGGNASAGCPGGGGGTGVPNSTYIAAEQVWSHSPEEDAELFALLANADTANAAAWTCRAHDWYMYTAKTINGVIPGSTTCSVCLYVPHILQGNRGSVWAEGAAWTYDWVYSSFNSCEKAQIVTAMTKFEYDINTNQGGIANGTPLPWGAENSVSLFQQSSIGSYGYNRSIAANNYSLLDTGVETTLGAAFDAADDPSTAHCAGGYDTVCADGTPNSVRAGFHYGTRTWLFLANANFEDPAVLVNEYNTALSLGISTSDQCAANVYSNPTFTQQMPCYGNGRGGLSQEGLPLYGLWLLHLSNACMSMETSGYNDPTSDPSISFCHSSWWDNHIKGIYHLTAPATWTATGQTFHLMFAYGPSNQSYDLFFFLGNTPAALYWQDKREGRTDRSNALGWLVGNLSSEYSLATNMSNNIPGSIAVALMQLGGSTPFSSFTDTRSTMAPAYYSYNAGTLVTSTGSWSPTTGSVYHSYCPRMPEPNHEEGYCGTFDFYRNGDWSTGDIYSYAFNDNTGYWTGETPETSNTPSYGNTPANLPNPTQQTEYIVDTLANRGAQVNNGYPWGENKNATYSDTATYTFNQIDASGDRNIFGPNPAGGGVQLSMDAVTGATRDTFWLKHPTTSAPDFLAVYGRGDLNISSFMRENFVATSTPTVTGTDVCWPSSLNATSNCLHVLLQPSTNIATYPVYPFAQGIASGYYMTSSEIEIDANPINHVTTEAHTTTNCTLFGTPSVCPTNRVNVIADKGVTGGSGCGTLTQVSTVATVGSCQYNVTSDYRYNFTPTDLAAGVTLHYDWSTPASSMRSLNVLEVNNFGTSATGATLVQSSSGQALDCGKFGGSTLVCFQRVLGSFTGTTFPASGATTIYVSDLTPNTSYTVSGAGAPSSATTDSAGVLTFAATGTGNITVGAFIPPAIASWGGGLLSGGSLQ